MIMHQYIDGNTGAIKTEDLLGDRLVKLLYSAKGEQPGRLWHLLTSARTSSLLAFLHFDLNRANRPSGVGRMAKKLGIDLDECVHPPHKFTSLRQLFERQIRYWDTRPMPRDETIALSPADARVIVGAFSPASLLSIKHKFFDYDEMLGRDQWRQVFKNGDFAVFRLTPDKYHYNHAPVSGVVRDIYTIDGAYHACNPTAVVAIVTPYSKNRRVVTIIDTDVEEGSRMGMVAMIEIVALMIGDIVQCYSDARYDHPVPVRPGLFIRRGSPKSLYRPGSSTDVLIFQPGRIRFKEDLLENVRRCDVNSRFSMGFGRPLVETDIRVRSALTEPRHT